MMRVRNRGIIPQNIAGKLLACLICGLRLGLGFWNTRVFIGSGRRGCDESWRKGICISGSGEGTGLRLW
jgi:hypothetical protein